MRQAKILLASFFYWMFFHGKKKGVYVVTKKWAYLEKGYPITFLPDLNSLLGKEVLIKSDDGRMGYLIEHEGDYYCVPGFVLKKIKE